MSRCFPFPAIGYSGKETINDSLIDLIKLQEERENSTLNRVREKVKTSDKKKNCDRVKKDNKKDQKDRISDEKEHFHPAITGSEKLKHNDRVLKFDIVGEENNRKRSFEVFEKSNLTEEHGRPVNLQKVCGSSDSTGNSSKRKRYSVPASTIQGNGNIIRIRLSSQKRDDPSTSGSLSCDDHITSQSTLRSWSNQEPLISQKDVSKIQEPVIAGKHLIPKFPEPYNSHKDVMPKVCDPSKGQKSEMTKVQESLRGLSTSIDILRLTQDKKTESIAPNEGPTFSGRIETTEPSSKKLSSHEKKVLKRETLYTKLFENLSPLSLDSELAVGQASDDWLFGKKNIAKRVRRGSDGVQACLDNISCSTSVVLQPRAHHLCEVGVYALPFTVPL